MQRFIKNKLINDEKSNGSNDDINKLKKKWFQLRSYYKIIKLNNN
jgi:hypothetical protein